MAKCLGLGLANRLGFATLCLGLAVLLMSVPPAIAQVQYAEITGRVTDPSGSVIPGATVTVTGVQTGVKRAVVTNSAGIYVVTPLNPGVYNVTVTKTGFKTETRSDLTVQVAETARVDMKLSLGQTTQTVTVKAGTAILQTEKSSLGNVVPSSGVVNLPLNGRNYLQLATLVPGAISQGLSQVFFNLPTNNISVNGARNSQTNYVIDGVNVMEQFTSGSSFTPPPDAIQEFKVQTSNMDAKYGGGSAVINAVLKSGTNQYHGDVYEFLRNNAMDARNFFSPTTPPLQQNQFGATFGGPIRKNRAFFFGSYQGTRILRGETFNSVVPSAAERNGNFSALSTQLVDPYTGQPLLGNQLTSISSQAQYLMDQFYPLPNTPGGTYVQSPKASTHFDQYDFRVDYQVDDADSLSTTYGLDNANVHNPGPFPNNGATGGPSRMQLATLSWTHSFGAHGVNLAQISYSREAAFDTGQGIGTNYTVQSGIGGFEYASAAYPGPPGINPAGYASISGYPFVPLKQTYNQYNFSDNLTWIKGKQTFEVGGDARWYFGGNLNGAWSRGDFFFTGVYTGNSFADFLSGVPFRGYRSFPRNWFGVFERDQDFYGQDTWRATPRLTITAGIRYNLIHPNVPLHNMYASANLSRNFVVVSSTPNGMINTNTQQIEQFTYPAYKSMLIPSSEVGLTNTLVHIDLNNWAPRFGLAYRLGHGLVIRSAYGIFYPLEQLNQEFSTGGANIPFIADELSNFNTTPVPSKTLADMFPPFSPTNLQLGQLLNFTIDPFQRDPYVQEWNFTVQKLIGKALSVQAAYVGSKGTKLTFAAPTNVPLPGPGPIADRRLNPIFGQGALLGNGGLSSYNAFQATVETRSWHGLYLLGAYTWAKALDDQSGDYQGSPVQNPNDLRAEYGISGFNVANRFTLSSTYNLPFLTNRHGALGLLGGWSTSNILTFQSGLPFTLGLATDPANTGTPMRPNRIANGKLSNPTINQWFDVAAFTTPPLYTYGDAARNILTGPGLKEWDFSLFKTFKLSQWHEGISAQFRGDFFNFTNTPHFGQPNATIGTTTAGEIFSAGAPREIQVALKIFF